MQGRVAGKVALITGAARGQGRSHALRLAEEGADIIGIDFCQEYSDLPYPLATLEDLQETARMVEALDRRMVIQTADVRDRAVLTAAVDAGVAEFGKLDIVVANAGILKAGAWYEITQEVWDDALATILTGTWNTIASTAPHLIKAGGGSIMGIGSLGGLKGVPFMAQYTAAKHGVVGIVKAMATELAKHSVRVNVVHPGGVNTVLTSGLGRMDELIQENPNLNGGFQNPLPIRRLEPIDISHAIVYLASDESKYVTGTELVVDGGNTNF